MEDIIKLENPAFVTHEVIHGNNGDLCWNFLKLKAPGTALDVHGSFNPAAVVENSSLVYFPAAS